VKVLEPPVESVTSTNCNWLLERGRQSLAGGDSSNMRVLSYHMPLVAVRGNGSRVWDADGNEFIDLNMAYGPLLFGHRPQRVIEAVTRQISESGSMLGFPTEVSMRAAEKLKRLFPSIELLRFANSGTEAVASAVRLSRTVTGRSKVVVFEGHYHGWSDAIFHRYHAMPAELANHDFGPALPGTRGMNGAPQDLLVVPWNDLDALWRCLHRYGEHVAAIVMEPVMGNAGAIPPEPGYLQGVREASLDHGALLVFDEVITGLRVAAGGAQEHYMVSPDVTVLSKALGGGYPIAAFGASREIMDVIVRGQMFHGGVYSGNAMSAAAAEAVLDEIIAHRGEIYAHLHGVGNQLADGLCEIFSRLGVPHVVNHVGPIISLFLTKEDVGQIRCYRDVREHCDFQKYIEFQHYMQRLGVYFHPNQFETMFLSTAHTPDDIATVLERFEDGARACLVK
jgi:glutamate-1-semialdehyde 2,1-aminomutase